MKNKKNLPGDQAEFSGKIRLGKELNFATAEAYRLMRTSLIFSLPSNSERRAHIIGITSANAGEGKSTSAMNLAYMLAEAQHQTVLIEADMRLPVIAKRLGLNPTPGLSNLLVGLGGKNIVQPSGVEDRLRVICSGDIPPNPSELLGSDNMKKMLDALSTTVDYIVIDLPPINEVSDALVVSQFTDGMVMVVQQDYARRRDVAEAIRQLEHADAKVLGFVMTHCTTGVGKDYKYKKKYSKYHKYGYGYGYGYAYAHARNHGEQTGADVDESNDD